MSTSQQTLSDLAEAYVRHLASMRYSVGTVRKIRGFLQGFVGWLHEEAGLETPERLHAAVLRQWHGHVTSRRTARGRPLKSAAINRHFIAVRGWLAYLAGLGYAHRALLEALPYVKEPRLLPGSVLGHEQMRGLLDAIPTDTEEGYRNRTMLELLYSTGIRAAELLGLDLESVDFTNRVVQVMGKGQKERVVPLGRTAIRFLEGYVAAVRPFLASTGRQRALFVNRAGRRVSYPAFLRLVHGVAGHARLDANVTPHTFRRSCTTELIRSGANMYHVKELLGHESLDTLKHYALLTIVDLKKTHARYHPRERDGKAPDGCGE